MKAIRNGDAGRTRIVTKCCGVAPETRGSFGQYYKVCPECGAGDIYRDVTQEHEYLPSAAEIALLERVEALERIVAQLTGGAA